MGIAAQSLHGAKICLIPRPENNYQPLALRKRTLLTMSGLMLAAKVMTISLVVLLPTTANLSTITTARILQLTNEQRTRNGLAPLKENDSLSKAAAAKAKDIIDHDYFAHISPSGVTPWFWIQQQGYNYTVAGENLAIDFVVAENVVSAWMNSPSHRDNILHPDYVETGIAVLTGEFQGSSSTVVVHMFGHPQQATTTNATNSSLAAHPPHVASKTPLSSPVPALTATPAPVKQPPATPDLKLSADQQTYANQVNLTVNGETGSIVHITANDKLIASVPITTNQTYPLSLNLTNFNDGALSLVASATNQANGLTSDKTAAITIFKDTTAPTINSDQLSFIISPATDTPLALFFLPPGDYQRLVINQLKHQLITAKTPLPSYLVFPLQSNPYTITAYDEVGNASTTSQLELLPAITTASDIDYDPQLSLLNKLSRQLITVVSLTLLILLLLAIFIQLKIQRPRMITHASLVILLALTLLFI